MAPALPAPFVDWDCLFLFFPSSHWKKPRFCSLLR
jgi:hypothetical protein